MKALKVIAALIALLSAFYAGYALGKDAILDDIEYQQRWQDCRC